MKAHCKLLLIAVILFASSAHLLSAQTARGQNFTTTFPFYVGKTLMPPGFYIVRMSPEDATVLNIQSKDGHHTAIVGFNQSYADQAHSHTTVTFRRYGTQEFLYRIWLAGQRFGMVIAPTEAETNMSHHYKAQEHSVPGNDN